MNQEIQTETPSGIDIQVHNGGRQYTPVGNLDIANADPGSLLSTVTSPSGGKVFDKITSDHRVTVGGIEMTIDQAEVRGLVSLENGQLTEPSGEASEEPQETVTEPDGFLEIDADLADTWENWTGAVREFTGSDQAVVATVSSFLSDTSKLPDLMVTMAEQQGMDPAVFHKQAIAIGQEFEAALDRKIAASGVEDTEQFWAQIHQRVTPPELNRMFVALVTTGDDAPINGLIQDYKRSMITRADVDAEVTVQVNGRRITTSVANAKRNGWL